MTTSYEVSKKLKAFLGKDAPASLESRWWCDYDGIRIAQGRNDKNMPWAYGLEDLLSKPFCEAFEKRGLADCGASAGHKRLYRDVPTATDLRDGLCKWYYNDGWPAVEKCLVELMEGK